MSHVIAKPQRVLHVSPFDHIIACRICRGPRTGVQGVSADSADGPASSSSLHVPNALAVTSWGDLYIGTKGSRVIRRLSNGTLTRVAGTGAARRRLLPLEPSYSVLVCLSAFFLFLSCAFAGAANATAQDGSPALAAVLGAPGDGMALSMDQSQLFFADGNTLRSLSLLSQAPPTPVPPPMPAPPPFRT